jgi:hypothetical protein
LVAFAASDISKHSITTAREVQVNVALALPTSLLCLVVGVLQLNMAWVLNLRSLMQGATISMLYAVVALGILITDLFNLILSAAPPRTKPALAFAPRARRCTHATLHLWPFGLRATILVARRPSCVPRL